MAMPKDAREQLLFLLKRPLPRSSAEQARVLGDIHRSILATTVDFLTIDDVLAGLSVLNRKHVLHEHELPLAVPIAAYLANVTVAILYCKKSKRNEVQATLGKIVDAMKRLMTIAHDATFSYVRARAGSVTRSSAHRTDLVCIVNSLYRLVYDGSRSSKKSNALLDLETRMLCLCVDVIALLLPADPRDPLLELAGKIAVSVTVSASMGGWPELHIFGPLLKAVLTKQQPQLVSVVNATIRDSLDVHRQGQGPPPYVVGCVAMLAMSLQFPVPPEGGTSGEGELLWGACDAVDVAAAGRAWIFRMVNLGSTTGPPRVGFDELAKHSYFFAVSMFVRAVGVPESVGLTMCIDCIRALEAHVRGGALLVGVSKRRRVLTTTTTRLRPRRFDPEDIAPFKSALFELLTVLRAARDVVGEPGRLAQFAQLADVLVAFAHSALRTFAKVLQGLGVVDFARGRVLAAALEAYFCCSNVACVNLRGQSDTDLKTLKCEGCDARFCSRRCQAESWRRGHACVSGVSGLGGVSAPETLSQVYATLEVFGGLLGGLLGARLPGAMRDLDGYHARKPPPILLSWRSAPRGHAGPFGTPGSVSGGVDGQRRPVAAFGRNGRRSRYVFVWEEMAASPESTPEGPPAAAPRSGVPMSSGCHRNIHGRGAGRFA